MAEQNVVVPMNATLAAAAEVQRRDIEVMHEKVSGIFATIVSPPARSRRSTAYIYMYSFTTTSHAADRDFVCGRARPRYIIE